MAFNTGSVQRKLIAIIEDFKRARQTWDEINTHAYTTANALCNSVIQSRYFPWSILLLIESLDRPLRRYVDEPQYWHPLLTMNYPNLAQKFDTKIHRIIDDQNAKLVDLVEKLAKQYSKMVDLYKELYILNEDSKRKYGAEVVATQPIFLTCPLNTYLLRMKRIAQMYKAELSTKRSCTSTKGFKNVSTREEGITLLSVWINQPSIIKSAVTEWEDFCQTELNLTTERY